MLVRAGYIVAFEDVRGKYRSEGEYVMNRPVRGPLNPTAVEDAILESCSRLGERIGKKNFEVAVRSSATAEDLPEARLERAAWDDYTFENVRRAAGAIARTRLSMAPRSAPGRTSSSQARSMPS